MWQQWAVFLAPPLPRKRNDGLHRDADVEKVMSYYYENKAVLLDGPTLKIVFNTVSPGARFGVRDIYYVFMRVSDAS